MIGASTLSFQAQAADLYAHYDATDAGSVSFTPATADEVSTWADQTANAFDATAAGGGNPILYPSASVSSMGLAGLDVPATPDSKLLAFTVAEQDAWLDFSSGGAAEAISGFAIFAVVKPDAVGVTSDVVFANHGNPGGVAESLSLRYEAGIPTIYLGGSKYTRNTVVAAGETVVLAVNYDSATGRLSFWDSESGTTGVATKTAADFSSVQNMYIAGSLNNGQGMDGMIGELKVYRGAMTSEEFVAEREALTSEWVQKAPINVTAEGIASDINLAWEDPNLTASDTYSVYRTTTQGDYGVAPTPIASGLTAAGYVDSTGVVGTTYYYVVTATRDGSESDFSAEVSATAYPATSLYAHYDASNAANVTTSGSNVTALADLSGNGYNADVGGATPGTVLYPDTTPSTTGLDILDMGAGRNILRTLIPGEQDALLDFSGTAAPNSGFSFFVVTRVDSLLAANVNAVLANNDNTAAGGLQLRLDGAENAPRLFLGPDAGASVSVVNGPAPSAGETLVLAANYNQETGELEFWNSSVGSSQTVTVAPGNFSKGNAIFIGGSNAVAQYMDGAIGEVKFYQGRLSAAAFAAEREALAAKWIQQAPANLTAIGSLGEITLDWEDVNAAASDSYNVYRSETPGSYGAALATGVLTTDYTDNTVVVGTTYYYVVTGTSIDADDTLPSNEASGVPYAAGGLYAHLDATDAGSVTTVNSNEVTGWADQTANGNDATSAVGTVLYPGSSLSPNGKAGMDMGTGRNTLKVFTAAAQDNWLDFTTNTGLARQYSGFSFFVVAKADSLQDGIVRDVVFTNKPDINSGLLVRLQGGAPELYLEGVKAEDSVAVVAGDTVVIAANYNAATGELEFWNSKAAASVTINVPAGDFSETTDMFLGGSNNPDQLFDGMIGELKIYRGTLDAAAFQAERDALVTKWITGTAGGYSAWQAANNTNGSFDQDHDADGVNNGLEYFLGGNSDTTGFTPLPSVVNTAGVFSVTWGKGSGYSGDYDVNFWVETSTTLGSWDKVALGGASIIDDPSFVKYTFLAPLTTKRFVRLKVAGP